MMNAAMAMVMSRSSSISVIVLLWQDNIMAMIGTWDVAAARDANTDWVEGEMINPSLNRHYGNQPAPPPPTPRRRPRPASLMYIRRTHIHRGGWYWSLLLHQKFTLFYSFSLLPFCYMDWEADAYRQRST